MNLTDEQWRLIEPILPPPSPADRGRPPIDRRAVLNGILWKIRTDNPWYDMPPDYPSHQTCYRCHRKWARDGVMQKTYNALFSDLSTRGRFDLAQALQDSTIRVNQIGSLGTLTIPLTLRDTWQWSTAVLCLRPVIEKAMCHDPSIRIAFEG
ncbi:MAG: transposase [Anaerolineales bacterium]|nr:transposase [Anaerolineales bacterium]